MIKYPQKTNFREEEVVPDRFGSIVVGKIGSVPKCHSGCDMRLVIIKKHRHPGSTALC